MKGWEKKPQNCYEACKLIKIGRSKEGKYVW
jgi:hypothetical protein